MSPVAAGDSNPQASVSSARKKIAPSSRSVSSARSDGVAASPPTEGPGVPVSIRGVAVIHAGLVRMETHHHTPARPVWGGGNEETMPLFLDVHTLPEGATAEDVAQAHVADLRTQDRFGVRYLSYWADAEDGKAFCLVDAPDAETAHTVHRVAHGLVADEIYPVVQG